MLLQAPLYTTEYGAAYVGNSLELLDQLEPNSIDLVITSPPLRFSVRKLMEMLSKKMLNGFLLLQKVYTVLASHGSFVIDLGGAYQSKRPVFTALPDFN